VRWAFDNVSARAVCPGHLFSNSVHYPSLHLSPHPSCVSPGIFVDCPAQRSQHLVASTALSMAMDVHVYAVAPHISLRLPSLHALCTQTEDADQRALGRGGATPDGVGPRNVPLL
jgi:hypothetical protein